mgnify:CR=1 FL=1
MATVTVKVRYSQEEAQDILCTAVEGGINYWADVTEVVLSRPDEYGIRSYNKIILVEK